MCIFVFSKYKILVVYFDTFSRPVFLYFILIHFMTKYLYFVSKYFMMYLCPALGGAIMTNENLEVTVQPFKIREDFDNVKTPAEKKKPMALRIYREESHQEVPM